MDECGSVRDSETTGSSEVFHTPAPEAWPRCACGSEAQSCGSYCLSISAETQRAYACEPLWHVHVYCRRELLVHLTALATMTNHGLSSLTRHAYIGQTWSSQMCSAAEADVLFRIFRHQCKHGWQTALARDRHVRHRSLSSCLLQVPRCALPKRAVRHIWRPKSRNGKYVRQLSADVLSVPLFGPRAGDQAGTVQALERESGGSVPCSQWGLPERRVAVELSVLGILPHSRLFGFAGSMVHRRCSLRIVICLMCETRQQFVFGCLCAAHCNVMQNKWTGDPSESDSQRRFSQLPAGSNQQCPPPVCSGQFPNCSMP